MDAAAKFDVTDAQTFEDEPTKERELVHPIGGELILSIQRDVATCDPTELRLVRRLMNKLITGRDGKPPLNLATDKRNWRDEARLEAYDFIWYWLIDEETRDGAQ